MVPEHINEHNEPFWYNSRIFTIKLNTFTHDKMRQLRKGRFGRKIFQNGVSKTGFYTI